MSKNTGTSNAKQLKNKAKRKHSHLVLGDTFLLEFVVMQDNYLITPLHKGVNMGQESERTMCLCSNNLKHKCNIFCMKDGRSRGEKGRGGYCPNRDACLGFYSRLVSA